MVCSSRRTAFAVRSISFPTVSMETWRNSNWHERIESAFGHYQEPATRPHKRAVVTVPGFWLDATVFSAFALFAVLNALT